MYDRNFWKDRSVQYPHRYTETDVGNGVKELIPTPGEVYQEGTTLTQERLNKPETGIAALYVAVYLLMQRVRLLVNRMLVEQRNRLAIAQLQLKNSTESFLKARQAILKQKLVEAKTNTNRFVTRQQHLLPAEQIGGVFREQQ